jgi:hypothetical protein
MNLVRLARRQCASHYERQQMVEETTPEAYEPPSGRLGADIDRIHRNSARPESGPPRVRRGV